MATEAMERLLDKNFQNDLLQNLNKLRKSNILCDTTIRADGDDFVAHRCVLTAASPYFQALFTSDFKESESNFVELKNVQSSILREVLQFIYTGEAKTDSSTAQDLIKTADFLMLPSLKSKASKFLEGTISITNCLALESFASQLNCLALKRAAVTYKMENFLSVVKSEDFKSLDFERMKQLISSDEIVVTKEEDVYEAVILWVKYDVSSRECLLPELLKCVRAFSMSKYSLREILDEEELVTENPTCTNILLQGLDTFLFPDQVRVLRQRPRRCLKSKVLAVVVHGGSGKNGSSSSNRALAFILDTGKWFELPRMPYGRTQHAAAVCGGRLYVVGGDRSSLWVFDPELRQWFQRDGNLGYCHLISFTNHREILYKMGGKDSKQGIIGSASKYNYKTNQWKGLSPMKTPRSEHCAVALEEFIYVIAGSDGNSCLKCVECYNPAIDQWVSAPDMLNARRLAAATAITGRKILVVGGFSDMNSDTIETSCEIFDRSLNQWSLVSRPTIPRAACGIVSVGNCVYLFGGDDGSKQNKLNSVESYDVQEDKWCHVSTMPYEVSSLQASLLQFLVEYLKDK